MPYVDKITNGETVKLRFEIKPESNYSNTLYTIRYFHYDGQGTLKLVDGPVLANNDRVRLESKTFRLNYTSRTSEAYKFLNDKGNLELSFMTSYQPEADATINSLANGLKMSISYVDLKGQPISINGLKQDSEFKARITVANLINDVENIALTYAIPSGWEIWNSRLYGSESKNYDNCDIRDNSVNFYFGIKKGESKTFEVRMRAAYLGNYLLPPTVCEDMYNPNCRAIISNRRISVIQ